MITLLFAALAAVSPVDCTYEASAGGPACADDNAIRIERADGSDWLVINADAMYDWGGEPGDRVDIRFPGSAFGRHDELTVECDHYDGSLEWRTTFDANGEWICEEIR